MQNLVRFTLILLILIAATLLALLVAGVLNSEELWQNFATVFKITAIIFVASAAVLFISKK